MSDAVAGMDPIGAGGLEVRGPLKEGYEQILTAPALEFVEALVREFRGPIREALARRAVRRRDWQSGQRLDFLPETAEVRQADWRVAPLPQPLLKRIVEITGPVDRKMIINALNSGADCFMADFEDASSPTWANMVEGQLHLADAARRRIAFDDPAKGKSYQLNDTIATLLVRPRGLHLVEDGVHFGRQPIPACLFDFGLYLFHNAQELLDRGAGPYFYLPKLESHLEARLWNDVFVRAQELLGLPKGTIKATVLIETLPGAFEMDEILYELRDHAAGLNCGRWDYIFSYIKVHRWDADKVIPDRAQVTMEQPFMRAYCKWVIRTCHRRGAMAIGGMAAQIPIKRDEEANARALEKVRADKVREVKDGHDGTWVAHPGLVPIAREIFEAAMDGPNQLDRLRDDVAVNASDLLQLPEGSRTEDGLRHNIRVGIQYLEAWLQGNGCVPLYDLMEDAATAEISRAQIYQWLTHRATLDDGQVVDRALIERLISEEVSLLLPSRAEGPARAGLEAATQLFSDLCFADEMPEFLTSHAYQSFQIDG